MSDDQDIKEEAGVKKQRVLDKVSSMSAPGPAPTVDRSRNLGKYLHPKGGSKTVDAATANGTVDANTGGAKVRATQ